MIHVMCMTQAGQITFQQKQVLNRRLDEFTKENLGSGAEADWIEVGSGSGFTAGKPSTTSIVRVTAESALDQPTRPVLLRELCAFWTAEACCTHDEVVAVIADPNPR